MKSRSSSFWTIFVFLGFAGLGVFLLDSRKASDRETAWICIALFGSMALITAMWEIGRNFQGEGALWRIVKIAGVERNVWFLPASRLQQVMLVAIMLLIGGVSGSIFFLKANSFQRWEMGVAGAVALLVAVGLIASTLRQRRGIGLLPEGILWLKDANPLLISWEIIEQVASTRVAQDVGHGLKTHLPAIGLRIQNNVNSVVELKTGAPVGSKTRAKWAQSRSETGFDVVYLEEALVLPVHHAQHLIRFFLENPRRRPELKAGETSLGFLETLLRDAFAHNKAT